MIKAIIDYLSVPVVAFLIYVLVLNALLGGWLMQMIQGQ